MSFIKRFLGKDPFNPNLRITAKDITTFIHQEMPIEENSNLDYKAIPTKDINFDELAKDVSAFANSEGGLLIFDVSEKAETDPKTGKIVRIYPGEITWKESSFKKEVIEQHLVGKIHHPIEDLLLVPVRKSSQDPSVIFLIDVPRSNNAPHMATPYNKYYKRLNFENLPMDHYEVQNLFRVNWTMKEKLVEKIYEPLSKVLGSQLKQLSNHLPPSFNEIEEIMSNKYYTMQIPVTLYEQIDYYNEKIKDYSKIMHYAYVEIRKIIIKNVFSYLNKSYGQEIDNIRLTFRAIANRSSIELYDIQNLLLNNGNIKQHLTDFHYEPNCSAIDIVYSNETFRVDIEDFDINIWKKCIENVAQNPKINNMKKNEKALWTEALDLLDEISKY